jgi:iron complex outermembrane receptor protein
LVPDELFFTAGVKLLTNGFTGFEYQPSGRLLWSPEQSWAAWAAVSRAVRIPSRADHDLRIDIPPLGTVFSFSPAFQSENVMAYEIGYRQQPAEWFSWDLALFYNQYESLGSFRSGPPPFGIPITNANDDRGEGYGVEVSAQCDVTCNWRLSGWYSYLQLQIHPGPLSIVSGGEQIEGSSPHNQVFLMSSHDLTRTLQLDLIGRYVDNLPAQGVPHYISLDMRLAWIPGCQWEFSVVGQNLLDSHHPEFGGTPITEIQRGVYGMVARTW